MKKISVNATINNLNGSPISTSMDKEGKSEVLTVGKAVASTLSAYKGKDKDPLKLWELAKRFYAEEIIEIDDSDLETVKDVVKKSDLLPLVVGQILAAFNSAN